MLGAGNTSGLTIAIYRCRAGLMNMKTKLVHFMQWWRASYTTCGSCLEEMCGCTPGDVSCRWSKVTCEGCIAKRRKPGMPKFECNCEDLRSCVLLYGNKHGAVTELRKRRKNDTYRR